MDYDEGTSGSSLLLRVVRVAVPWLALILVVAVIWSLVADYRVASQAQGETSSTVEATSTASGIPAGEPYVAVLSDGLNLRAEPSTSAAIVAVLDEGQQLVFLEEGTGWYRVRTVEGAEGWVAAGGRYTQLVQP